MKPTIEEMKKIIQEDLEKAIFGSFGNISAVDPSKAEPLNKARLKELWEEAMNSGEPTKITPASKELPYFTHQIMGRTIIEPQPFVSIKGAFKP